MEKKSSKEVAQTPIVCDINEYKVEHVNGKETVFYVMSLKYKGKEWQIKKRYNEFQDFYNMLVHHHQNVFALPGKTLFAIKKASDLDDRRIKLSTWCKNALLRNDFYSNTHFIKFFELESYAEDRVLNDIWQCGKLTHPAFGYRDFDFNHEKNLLFSVTSEMKPQNRITAGEKNGRPELKSSVGALECYVRIPPKSEFDRFLFDIKWVRGFTSQAICLHYNPENNLVLVGCDNGELIPIQLNPDDVTDYTELKAFRLHKSRIMAIWMDSETKKIYTIGEDKRLCCLDFKTKTLACGNFLFAKLKC
jgi:hypothetical protein